MKHRCSEKHKPKDSHIKSKTETKTKPHLKRSCQVKLVAEPDFNDTIRLHNTTATVLLAWLAGEYRACSRGAVGFSRETRDSLLTLNHEFHP